MSNASGSTDEVDCEELPGWGLYLGVSLGVAGSIGINIGQNLQAAGIAKLALAGKRADRPCESQMWIAGQVVFVIFSLINFGCFALAPAAVLTPLESIQFVTNIYYNKFINRVHISRKMYTGVGLTCCGTVLTVVFGAAGGGSCHSLAVLEAYWGAPLWLSWFVVSLSVGLAAVIANRVLRRLDKEGKLSERGHLLLPLTFTLYSALLGGSCMIVHSKVLSELLGILFQGDASIFTSSWLLYVELALVTVCGSFWIVQLTTCLVLYNPLLILPLMVGTYIFFGGIAGGIFFQEFHRLHEGFAGYGGWAAYACGLCLVLAGLYTIAVESNGSFAVEGGDPNHGASPATLKPPASRDPSPPIHSRPSEGAGSMASPASASPPMKRTLTRANTEMSIPVRCADVKTDMAIAPPKRRFSTMSADAAPPLLTAKSGVVRRRSVAMPSAFMQPSVAKMLQPRHSFSRSGGGGATQQAHQQSSEATAGTPPGRGSGGSGGDGQSTPASEPSSSIPLGLPPSPIKQKGAPEPGTPAVDVMSRQPESKPAGSASTAIAEVARDPLETRPDTAGPRTADAPPMPAMLPSFRPPSGTRPFSAAPAAPGPAAV